MSLPSGRAARGFAVACVVLVVMLGGIELAVRLLEGPERRARLDAERAILQGRLRSIYEPRPHTVYAHARGESGANAEGFQDFEWALAKRPGVLRIACLGGSTTEGGNPHGLEGSYPFLLDRVLEERTGREFEVMNCGMSSWTTAEMVVLYYLLVQDYAPDLVVMHEVVNDVEPRSWPDFRADYTHYRRPWSAVPAPAWERALGSFSHAYLWWRFRGGVPDLLDATVVDVGDRRTFQDGAFPPGTERPFRRNVLSIARGVRDAGGDVLLATLPCDPDEARSRVVLGHAYRVGIGEHNGIFRELAAEHGFMLCDLERLGAASPELFEPHFIDLVHIDAAGNRQKAEAMADVLLAQWPALADMAGDPARDD